MCEDTKPSVCARTFNNFFFFLILSDLVLVLLKKRSHLGCHGGQQMNVAFAFLCELSFAIITNFLKYFIKTFQHLKICIPSKGLRVNLWT